MDFGKTESVRSTPSRHEKSLGLLTMKFVNLLKEAKDGVLDLKVAADSLAVKQKRRIYDITNVLEGVGLIEKKNKNIIQWRGDDMGSESQEVMEQLKSLKAEIAELEDKERELDKQKAWLEEDMKRINNDPNASSYKFVTHEDICNAFNEDTLLAVVAPVGTQLEVPLPETGQSGQKKHQINLRSQTAPIQVMLINRDSDYNVPVVFPVPPTDEICSMPTPPSTPARLQRVPVSVAHYFTSNSTSSCCKWHPHSDRQKVLPENEVLTPMSTPPRPHMEFPAELQSIFEHHQKDLAGPESQPLLDTFEDQMKCNRHDGVDLIDELMSTDDMGYSFNLDGNNEVSDIFDVKILNY